MRFEAPRQASRNVALMNSPRPRTNASDPCICNAPVHEREHNEQSLPKGKASEDSDLSLSLTNSSPIAFAAV
jgi:hypothetical protein